MYEISELTPGVYTVTAQTPFPGYEPLPQKVEIAAGEIKTVDIYADFEKAVVEGFIRDQDGKPIPSARLSGVLCGNETETSTTDERGHFRFDRVTPGDRFVWVNARGYMGEHCNFTAKKSETVVLEFRLKRATCKVYGTVADEKGKPLQAEVRLLKSGVVIEKATPDPESGYYEFQLLPGEYQILCSGGQYAPNTWEGSISGEAKVDFSLRPSSERPAGYAKDLSSRRFTYNIWKPGESESERRRDGVAR
jgi:hypothetical protein